MPFERNLAEHGEVGAPFAAYHGGVRWSTFWGGVADADTGWPWERDAIALFFC
ncbi:MAG: hypothetical protein IPM45_17955 [Acidimicrobiales bacterium]|nr:hypothetical protein [Acidimicrobiales bacterium]